MKHPCGARLQAEVATEALPVAQVGAVEHSRSALLQAEDAPGTAHIGLEPCGALLQADSEKG